MCSSGNSSISSSIHEYDQGASGSPHYTSSSSRYVIAPMVPSTQWHLCPAAINLSFSWEASVSTPSPNDPGASTVKGTPSILTASSLADFRSRFLMPPSVALMAPPSNSKATHTAGVGWRCTRNSFMWDCAFLFLLPSATG